MNYNGHRMEIEKIKSRVLAAFVRANPGIVGCVRFKYRKLELSLVGKWSREEQEWSEGMSPEKVKGSPRQLFLSERHATLLVVVGGGGGGGGCVYFQLIMQLKHYSPHDQAMTLKITMYKICNRKLVLRSESSQTYQMAILRESF